MQTQSTAPLSRHARRAYAMLATVSILLLGTGIGVMAYGGLMEPSLIAPYQGVVVAPTATVAPPSGPMQAALTQSANAPGAVGRIYRLSSAVGLWVERVGLQAYRRAESDHDGKGQARIGEVFEHFFPDPGTRVTVIVRDGDISQIEIIDGQFARKRGWTDRDPAYLLIP